MRRIILLIAGFCVFCMGALHAQTPVRGLTVTGALDTMRTIETTPRFVGPTGELHRYPALTINGEVLPAPDLTALTFEAMTAGAVVTFTPTPDISTLSIQYSFNGGAWTTYTAPIMLANVGDKVYFRGNNAAYSTDSEGSDYCSNFSCSDSCYIYGNIMSLVDATNYPTNTTLTEEYAFSSLFSQNDYIFNHPTQMLFLPATTLTDYCYSNMFGGCTELTIAPALLATTLAKSCYEGMFNNCLSLTAAPELPATTLQESCYRGMFYNDTSLTTAPALPAATLAEGCYVAMFADCANMTTAPELPATTLSIGCYMEMFAGCTSLTTAPALPAMTMTVDCYEFMFYGCTSLTTAPELPAMTLDYACYSDMFAGCTSLTTAPVLPATVLADWCYSGMFSDCENLNSVTCLATSFTSSNCTYNWLMNVAPTGTFVKAASMTEWTLDSPSGIPIGWTVNGKLPGEFTVNAGGGKVNFSQGNLQYQANTDTWRFAEHQYDYVGDASNGNVYVGEMKCNNANISNSYSGWIDLLGWGTGNAPTKATTSNGDYSTFTDWGVNAISNGGNTAEMWRTLSKDEWVYFFEHHTKGWSTVNGVNGYVIRPDGISTAVATSYTSSEWAVEEAAGSVFLLAAGSRDGTSVGGVGSWGDYWSSTPYTSGSSNAYYLYFNSSQPYPANNTGRFGGRSVRLVYEKPLLGAGTETDPYLISSEADWYYLANRVNNGNNFSGKFFRQTANIDVTTMVGVGMSKPFSGTYDGDGKTLNLNINTTSQFAAPFQYIVDATIKNVVTTGTVYSTDHHLSGLVGLTDGTCTIQNCRVSANVGGAQYSGGIVGHCWHANISIIGCVYSGTLNPASGQKTGGILGWGGDGGGHTITISNCLFAGSLANTNTMFHPIATVYDQIYNPQPNTKNLSNTYYTLGAKNITDEDHTSFVQGLTYKGKFARSIVGGSDVTVAHAGAATVYNVSGITSYGTGILYGGVLYAGDGEAVNLTLSHGAAPTGFTFNQYTVTGGGSLANPTTNSPTLTMTDANQTINVQWTP
ncbi:MAG: hypothetical protein J5644_03185 [Bacteroidales bacterium]|nr:hypothetical protein [Bacteroidales bacterium]